MARPDLRFAAVLSLALLLSNLAHAQDSSRWLFVPNQYAPLSSYQEKTSPSAETLVFPVRGEIINFVLNNAYSGWIAHQDAGGVINLLQVSEVDASAGVVRLHTNLTGRFVVVAEPFTNDFPIVTHWKQSLNSGRGGFELGAADPLGWIDFYPEQQSISRVTAIYDEDPASPYVYNTDQYALFSGDPIQPEARVPGFERYVGENYAIFKISERMAVYMSLRAVEQTGFPLLHRSYPWAFYPGSPQSKRAAESIPAFHIAHAVVMGLEPDKSSLATFILPPFWRAEPAIRYPVAFNGFYDIHETVSIEGMGFAKVIGDLYNQGYGSSVGILWNGGGARGAYSVQWSAYQNMAWTFEWASIVLGIDKQKIVTTGLSRGGITALAVASNPFYDNYRVAYALAYNPGLKFGEHISQWSKPTYPGMYLVRGWATGYMYAHRSDFVDPLTGWSGAQLFMNNMISTTDPATMDAWSLAGDWLLGTLQSKGTSVLISQGTHDAWIPFKFAQEYYDRLLALGISAELDVGYRFGHNYFTDPTARLLQAMKEVAGGTNAPLGGIRHYKRAGEGLPTEWKTPQAFTPDRPIVLEFPKLAYRGETARTSIIGAPGTLYGVVTVKIDDAKWAMGQIEFIGEGQTLYVGVIPGAGELKNETKDFLIPADWALGHYLFALFTSQDGGGSWQLGDLSRVPHPYFLQAPVFEIKATEPAEPFMTLNNALNIEGRGWGLGSH